ncbi:MAG: 30S ribosomal protein S4 [Candidatus Omnitrophica bacterium]|nr:30S ribosomal protein S4 [Candidatus Omnitrophota bacterium]MCK5491719.1 30S ribosomal protein S4 [Candidatus Omnitrophota bacterium]
MGRYVDAKCRLCRRAGMKLFLKGQRCETEKCSFSKRPTPPGMVVKRPSKPTNYALQLKEKQKLKRMYGMLEKQFKRFFSIANKSKGVTGRTLIQLLERRLDNVIFRSLYAFSRNHARQIVRHGFVFINGKRVDIPSYIVKEGENIEIRAKEALQLVIKDCIESNAKGRSVPTWLQVDNPNYKVGIVRLPEKEDLIIQINEQLIVELYSK